jgi:hypothetical protein
MRARLIVKTRDSRSKILIDLIYRLYPVRIVGVQQQAAAARKICPISANNAPLDLHAIASRRC